MVEQVKIAITLEDDSLVIMSFVVNDGSLVIREPSEENINNEILRFGFASKFWRIIEENEIIQDSEFRNAWKDDNNGINIDMPKAREIHRNNLRIGRTGLLNSLDVQYLRADEYGDQIKKSEIIQKKQILRDIPADPRIDSAQTIEELKSVWFPEDVTTTTTTLEPMTTTTTTEEITTTTTTII